jgi:hypothetical protein
MAPVNCDRLGLRGGNAMKRLRSIILTAAICLALGAVVSYGVAWGLVLRTNFVSILAAKYAPAGSVARTTLPFEPVDYDGSIHFPPSVQRLDVEEANVGWGRSVRRFVYSSEAVVSESMAVIHLNSLTVYEERFGFPMQSAAKWSTHTFEIDAFPVMPQPAARVLDGGWWAFSRLQGIDAVRFPLRPIWPGLIINSIFYGLLAWGLWLGVLAVRARWRRTLGDVCLKCRYPRGTAPVCTECGEAFEISMASNAKAGG